MYSLSKLGTSEVKEIDFYSDHMYHGFLGKGQLLKLNYSGVYRLLCKGKTNQNTVLLLSEEFQET